MTRDELARMLNALELGQSVTIGLDDFEKLFPPGGDHPQARREAYLFGKERSCTINLRPDTQIVCFRKDA